MFEHKGKSGIYKIRNKINNKVYIGKTRDFYKRYYHYVSDSRNQSSRINRYLLASFTKHGFDNFEFSVVEFCGIDECSERELYWMEFFNCLDKNFGYNLRSDSSSGMVTHDDTRLLISNNIKQQWADGVRDGHSEKLKLSWENRDRLAQSELLCKTLTKYIYIVSNNSESTISKMSYNELKLNNLQNVLSIFYKKKLNKVNYKNFTIERVLIKEENEHT